MKNLITIIGAICLMSASAFAADVLRYPSSQYPVISSSVSTTNALVGQVWPNSIAASTVVTNLTPISVTTGKDVAFQFTAAAMQTNGGTVTVGFARSISGGYPTNAIGTSVKFEQIGSMSLVLPANTATSETTMLTNFTSGSVLGGAYPVVYVYSITTPANVTLTNYSIYAFNK